MKSTIPIIKTLESIADAEFVFVIFAGEGGASGGGSFNICISKDKNFVGNLFLQNLFKYSPTI